MSEAGANTPANHFGGSFGPNEWLVQEMYERYQSDPASVDKAWWDFFADFKGTPQLNGKVNGQASGTKTSSPPIPKSQLTKSVEAPVIKPVESQIVIEEKVSTTTYQPADLINKPAANITTPGVARIEPLRGVAARVVQSMEGSLSVPTATSVRVIPAKLLIDNRTVINNHLKRGRGGKVSFTHIIDDQGNQSHARDELLLYTIRWQASYWTS